MLVRVQKTQQGLAIPITAEMAESLDLDEGTQANVLPVSNDAVTRYVTVKETLAAFERTLPEHKGAYRELAK